MLRPAEDRIEKLADALMNIMKDRRLAPALASKIYGKLMFLSSQYFGRLGRALLRAFFRLQHESGRTGLNPQLIAALTFWHGAILNDWANQLVAYWSDGKGNMVTSAMEDTGSYLALSWLDKIGRADKDRMMVLRTGSNYTMQPPSRSAAENLLKETKGYKYAGLEVAVEAGYLVGSVVVDEIINNWERYENNVPGIANE